MKLKKLLKCSLAASIVFGCAGFVAGCGKDDSSTSKNNDKQYEIYKLAVEAGMTDLTYEQWLVTIKGDKGEKGDDGHTPVITIGSNGNWFVDGVDTTVKAAGSVGATGNDGSTWLTGTVAPNNNVGKNQEHSITHSPSPCSKSEWDYRYIRHECLLTRNDDVEI